ncbi:MAG: von Willebrand factor type A domain-containing protein [Acidobacteria bacterium]|nr:von Willebrand factor type A domain-containing protein [Acidobacteriota bacterium]
MKIFNRHIADQLSAYLQNELTDKQASKVESHLSTCKACKKECEEIEQGIFLAKQLSLSKCPDLLWNGVESQLKLQEKSVTNRPSSIYQLFPKTTWSRAFATAAIVIIFYALGSSFIAIIKKSSITSTNNNEIAKLEKVSIKVPEVTKSSVISSESEAPVENYNSDARPQRVQTLPTRKIAPSKGVLPSLILLNPGVFQPENTLRSLEKDGKIGDKIANVGSYNFNQNSTEQKIELSVDSLEAKIDNRRIDSLPINRRNFLDFSLISPNSKGSTATSSIPFNGRTARSNTFTVDGLDNNDSSVVGSTPNQNVTKEFQVVTDNYEAEFGRLTKPSEDITKEELNNSTDTEAFKNYGVNVWTKTKKDSFSTFAVDVDTGSYTIARRILTEGSLPPANSVRVEEFVNYFKYQYPSPITSHPFSLTMEASASPFNENRYLLRVGLKGREVRKAERPATHLTFLVDNSGSMNSDDKLGLVKKSLKMLVKNLEPQDTVAITTYAGGVSLVLPPTSIVDKEIILNAIDNLVSSGGTAMEAGIDLAYKQAHASFQVGSINRIIICSDGDANIGKTEPTEILKQIKSYVDQGITVSTIGFGMGNYKDAMMEQFANKGNGNYYYIDNMSQAKRIFVEQLNGTLQVIAKDVKVQVEFNPSTVSEYRLVGYENRDIADEDFRNDKVDAGEIGAGHTVTAIYEVKLRKQPDNNLATVRLRYKTPDAQEITPAEEVAASFDLSRLQQNFDAASEDFRFSIAVAAFAEVLRESFAAKDWSLEKIISITETASQPNDKERQEFLQLVKKAQQLKLATSTATPENN